MKGMQPISSADNRQLKEAIRLRESRFRRRQQRMIIDGWKEVARARRSGVTLLQCFVCDEQIQQPEFSQQLEQITAGTEATCYSMPKSLFQKMAFGQRTNELIAVAEIPETSLEFIPHHANALICVLEGVEKPGNIGAVIRSACGAGVDGVIVADPACDLYNPNALRASLGAIFSLPICTAAAQDVKNWLIRHAFQIVATRIDAVAVYHEINFQTKSAILLGSEAQGLTDTWKGESIRAVKIPMGGEIDSLNISVSAAILFYEAQRQRSQTQSSSTYQ
jgi:TrmH family RNA methyltransferase